MRFPLATHMAWIGLAFFVQASPGLATDLTDELRALLESHDRIASAREQLGAAGERVDESYGILYPNLSTTAFVGKEDRRNPNADDTILTGRELNLTLTQRVYDFGASDATIDTAKLRHEQEAAITHQGYEPVILERLGAELEFTPALCVECF